MGYSRTHSARLADSEVAKSMYASSRTTMPFQVGWLRIVAMSEWWMSDPVGLPGEQMNSSFIVCALGAESRSRMVGMLS